METFSATGSMATARQFHTATLLRGGTVLVAGGGYCDELEGDLGTTELYNPATGAFGATDSMVAGRLGHTATPLPNGTVLVAGGSGGIGDCCGCYLLASVELYDPAPGAFNDAGSMATDRSGHSATLLLNGRVLIVGGTNGYGGDVLASAELYSPI